MSFEEELERVLPADLPHRADVIQKAARHLDLVVAANEYMNLTRIATPKEAAIKHVADCLLPWRHFSHARRILDAGTGAGFPGIPLALVFPETHFTLTDSIQKKARFIETVIEDLKLENVDVAAERAESLALEKRPDVITARAVAPLERLVHTFGKCLERGMRLLLYKGPDAEDEFSALNRSRADVQVVDRYELPEGFGMRTLIAVAVTMPGRAERDRQARPKPR